MISANSVYTKDRETGVWSYDQYKGINYNDGDVIEERIRSIIKGANDVSVMSEELRSKITDWHSKYHIGRSRANILRPFKNHMNNADVLEVGSGCGAITRFLGECGANVIAIEGSMRRAEITKLRTRDLSNVEVISESFEQVRLNKKFDIVTLIGVLEYANLFVTSDLPAQRMLQITKNFLKPDGKLIIAIENQFGLKYFAGANEDHLGHPMVGIEGRYTESSVETFGITTLKKIIRECGFKKVDLYLPFPDYKFPVSIITPKGIQCANFNKSVLAAEAIKSDFQNPIRHNFIQELAWRSLDKNNLLETFSNSFLIVASDDNAERKDFNALGYHYSTERSREFCKEKIFLLNNDEKIIVNSKYIVSKSKHECDSKLINNNNDEVYIIGRPLINDLVDVISIKNWKTDDLATFVRKYVSIIELIIFSKDNKTLIHDNTLLPGNFIDLIPRNIIIDQIPYYIDDEWNNKTPISLGWLLFHGLLVSIESISQMGAPADKRIKTKIDFIKACFDELSYQFDDSIIKKYLELEFEFFKNANGVLTTTFDSWWNNTTLPVRIDLNEYYIRLKKHESFTRSIECSVSWKITMPLRIIELYLNKVSKLFSNFLIWIKQQTFKDISS
jgi:2-polyprenyl-3-methyl-5-hydroxy-6-metoxy-1,4-benzoquinol methylase